MYRIKTMNKISPKGLSRLDANLFEVGDTLEHEQAILVRSAKLHDYDFPAELLAIARAGAGVNNIPLDRCSEAGIVVFNTPGANANAVKELAVCALLLASRNISGGIEWAREQARAGADVAAVVEKGKAAFAGVEIMGKTLGVVGLGAIGALVANVAVALGMDVVGYDPFLSVPAALSLSPKVRHVKDLAKLYAEADFVSLHLPMTGETRGSINAAAFAQMKDQVRIINLARGELVHNADMAAALQSGKVAAYVTDFPDSEITLVNGVYPIPHLGASTEESEENCAIMAANQVKDYLENGNIVNSVNLPNLTQDWQSATRVCILAKSNPNLLADVTAALSAQQIGTVALSSKEKGAYAYLIADVSADVGEAAVAALSALSGVQRVRVLKK
jgi:D-3-phosphoglycerate dehydrogenase